MVDITYRTLGPWGSGKGANLQPSEVDANFYSLAQAIVNIQDNPEEPNGIYSITVSGTQMTITLNDGTVLGPYTLPVLTFRWRGEWDRFATYAQLDVVTVSYLTSDDAGIFMCTFGHTGDGAEFIADRVDAATQTPYWQWLFGSVDMHLSSLPDVELTDLTHEDFLRWSTLVSKWQNVHLGAMAYQEYYDVNITGGNITGLPTPMLPTDAATKGYVDALPAGMTAPSPTLMANIIGYVNPAIPNTLSDVLDATLAPTGSVRGNLLHRSGVGWEVLPPGMAGNFLQTHGAGVDVSWEPGGAGVTAIYEGTGITFGGTYIFSTGTISLAPIADDTLLANTSGASAAPVPTPLTTLFDSVFGTTRGQIIARGISGWSALTPGISGQYLKTTGSGSDVIWDSPSGSGTVTSIAAGTGISTGGSPITGTGTVSLAAIATGSLLANMSGSSAAPVPATASLFFDSAFGSTQGSVLYRSASAWVVLTPGTSGQILTTGGAAANPSWQNAPIAGASIANLRIVSNISGSTAAAAANTLTDLLDAIISSARGTLLYRGSAGWVGLAPGTAGQVLTTGGAAGDPSWATGGGGGGITDAPSDGTSYGRRNAAWAAVAPLASPTFSGTPAAPTATAGTNTTQIANTAFVTTAIAGATAGGSSITTSDTPPTSPADGDAWWDSIGGQLYIRYDDGTSAQWVPASNQPGPPGANGTNANITGLTAGQIPIAGSATSLTSSGNLSGDVTTSGSLATTIANNAVVTAKINNAAVTYAKIQNVANNRILGNTSGSAAAPSEIALPLSVTNGGTGATTAPLALTALGAVAKAGDTMTGALTVGGILQAAGILTTADITSITDNSASCGTPGVSWYQVSSHVYNTTSDPAQKADIAPIPAGALDQVAAIAPVSYRWKDDEADAPKRWGFLAPDVAAAMGPDFAGAGRDKESGVYTLAYNDLTAVLWAAVQELSAKVQALEAAR